MSAKNQENVHYLADKMQQNPSYSGGYQQSRPANVQTTYGEVSREPMAQITREEVDAKLATADARSETRIVEVLGEIKAMNARIDGIQQSTAGVKATIIFTGIAVVTLVVAVLSYGQQWFGIGITTRDIVRATVQEMKAVAPQTNEKTN